MTLIDRFFKPKWQNPDPQIRKRALQSLAADDPVVTQLAREDADPGMRRAALARVSDLELIGELAAQDPEAGVREFAQARFRNLLAGNEPGCPPLEQRLSLAEKGLDAAMAEFLAGNGAEPELRLAALQHVDNQSLYGDLAINDAAAAVRWSALERISDPEILATVARQTRNKDKRVNRKARQRVDALQTEQRHQQQIAAICEGMEGLVWDGESGPASVRFGRLQEQWSNLQAEADETTRQRIQGARDSFAAQLKSHGEKRVQRETVCRELAAQIDALKREVELRSDDERVGLALAEAGEKWQAIGTIEDTDSEGRRLLQRYRQLCRDLETRERELKSYYQQARQRHALLKETRKLLKQSGQVKDTEVEGLKQRWQRLPRAGTAEQMSRLQGDFDTLTGKLGERLRRQVDNKQEELSAIEAGLEQLQQSVDAGELQKSIELSEAVRERLKSNISLSQRQMQKARDQLQTAAAGIGKLRDWRRWGTDRARESWCERVEQLPATEQDPLELARQVKEARAAWKALDSNEGAASRALWKRFNAACELAYAPAKVHFEAQSEQRQRNLEARQALCLELEQIETETQWEDDVDWQAIAKLERGAQRRWREAGPVNRADKKAIDERHKTALKQLQKRLKPQLEQDVARRRGLVRKVEALLESEDLNAAISAAKQAQSEWQPKVTGPRRQEQALWQEFRAACDAIFNRRDQQRQTEDGERQQNLKRKTELCEELETLATLQGEQLLGARSKVQAAQQTWEALGPVPREASRALQQRFANAGKQFEQAHRQQQQRHARAELDAMQQRAAICAGLEARLEQALDADATDDDRVATARAEWQRLAVVAATCEDPLLRRFEAVAAALDGDIEARQSLSAQLADNDEAKRKLCLRLEIATGTETPAEFRQERMSYQVARLSESMAGRDVLSAEERRQREVSEIECEWYASGLLPASHAEKLDSRFRQALAQHLNLNP